MDLSQIPLLTTAIALCIAWALFALFCSYLHEGIAQLLAERGRFLKRYLFKQLYDASNGFNWALLVYQHGAIRLLTRDARKPTNDINPQLFAKVLIEAAGNLHLVKMQIASNAAVLYKSEVLNKFSAAMSVLLPGDITQMLKQSFADAQAKAQTSSGATDESVLYNQLVANIQTWYDQLTQRISLWYKKTTRKRLFLLGLILAALLNIDSIQLFGQFSENEASRNAMITYYKRNQSDLERRAADLSTDTVHKADEQKAMQELKTVGDSLNNLSRQAQLPIGLSKNLYASLRDDFGKKEWEAACIKILGVLISAVAASFGATFWFDLLKKVYTPKTKS